MTRYTCNCPECSADAAWPDCADCAADAHGLTCPDGQTDQTTPEGPRECADRSSRLCDCMYLRLCPCPDGPAVIHLDCDIEFPDTENHLVFGRITTADGLEGVLLRERSGRWIQATVDGSREVPLLAVWDAMSKRAERAS